MVGRTQQDAAQPDNIAGDRERDDLAPTIGQQLEAAGPTGLKNEGLMAGLPLVRELSAPLHREGSCLQLRQALQLVRRQDHKRVQLPGQDAVHVVVRYADLSSEQSFGSARSSPCLG